MPETANWIHEAFRDLYTYVLQDAEIDTGALSENEIFILGEIMYDDRFTIDKEEHFLSYVKENFDHEHPLDNIPMLEAARDGCIIGFLDEQINDLVSGEITITEAEKYRNPDMRELFEGNNFYQKNESALKDAGIDFEGLSALEINIIGTSVAENRISKEQATQIANLAKDGFGRANFDWEDSLGINQMLLELTFAYEKGFSKQQIELLTNRGLNANQMELLERAIESNDYTGKQLDFLANSSFEADGGEWGNKMCNIIHAYNKGLLLDEVNSLLCESGLEAASTYMREDMIDKYADFKNEHIDGSATVDDFFNSLKNDYIEIHMPAWETNADTDTRYALDDYVNFLNEFKEKYGEEGYKVSVDYYGHTLFSDTATLNNAYLEIAGMTKDEFSAFMDERYANKDFNKEQLLALQHGHMLGLSDEQVAIAANPEFTREQMDELICAQAGDGLTMEQVGIMANKDFSPEQMNELYIALACDKIPVDIIASELANPGLNEYQMKEKIKELEKEFSKESEQSVFSELKEAVNAEWSYEQNKRETQEAGFAERVYIEDAIFSGKDLEQYQDEPEEINISNNEESWEVR